MHWLKLVSSLKALSRAVLFYCCVFGISNAFSQEPSVLATGKWYKLAITQSGIYQIDAAQLKEMGFDVTSIAPDRIRIFGNGGAMLPQRNDAPRAKDLLENAILVNGEEDGRFDVNDQILFYAEGPRTILYDLVKSSLFHQINIYSDTTYYFLTIGDSKGLRIKSESGLPAQKKPVIDQFDDYWFHEEESANILRSGRDWWGEYLGASSAFDVQANLPGIVPSSTITLLTSAVAAAQVNTKFIWQLNGQAAGESAVGTVSSSQYDLKGIRADGKYSVSVGTQPAVNIPVGVTYDKNGQSSAQAYLNYFALQVKRELKAYETQQIYRFVPGKQDTVTYSVKNMPAGWQYWNITDTQIPVAIVFSGDGSFTEKGGKKLRQYIGFTAAQALKVGAWQAVNNQNIRSIASPDLLIITAAGWTFQAAKLASFRESEGLKTAVVPVDQIYNEFASGKPDLTALRDFIRHLYLKEPGKLKYVLLFGDAAYDYKNLLQNQTLGQRQSWIPVYESRESLNPIYTYSSDDYFGFMEDAEGDWLETSAGDHTLEIGIGRIPVKSVSEAEITVDKLINYSNSKSTYGSWRNKVNFVADDGDGGIHQQHADELARLVQSDLLPTRIFLDAFPQTTTALGQKVPDVNQAIKNSIQQGTLILNYTGHGGTTGWAEEQVLTLTEMQTARGYNNLPLLITATCDFGRYDDPGLVSGGELMVLSPRGAAVGAVSTTRPVYSSTNFTINKAFYDAFIATGSGARMGDIIKLTKNNSLVGSLNRNFALLGDPSMQLSRGQGRIKWAEKPDTLRALQKVRLKGAVYMTNGTQPDTDFTGTARVTIYDKQVTFRTLGNEGDAKSYSEFRSRLFDGNVSVEKGNFICEFVMPKDIDYRLGLGRASVYAVQADSLGDAAGQLDLWVGGSADLAEDNEPPKISAFMNTPAFRDGDVISGSSVLFLKLSDQNGINVSKSGIGHTISLTLNDTLQLDLNDYYVADQDQYVSGTVRYPFENLLSGNYTIRIKVWDTYNNSSEISFGFQVGQAQGIQLSALKVYPNPFYQELSFEFNHNRGDEDIEVVFSLFHVSGRQLSSFKWQYYNSETVIRETIPSLRLNLSNNIPGTYIYSVRIRSLKDNSADIRSGNLLRSP